MTKAQKIIVMAAAGLIVIAFLFPPYKDCPFNEKGEWIGKCYIKWEFNRTLRDMIDDIKQTSFKSSGMTFGIMEINYPLMRRLLFLEIFGVVVLAGAALLITKKNG